MPRRRPAEADALERRAAPAASSPCTASATSSSTVSRDEVAARILREVAGAAAALDRARRPARAARPRSCASVVLPDPFGPSSATISPRRSSRSTPSSTGTAGRYANETSADRRATSSARGSLCSRNTSSCARVERSLARPATRAPSPRGASSRMRPPSTKSTRVASSSARATRCSERTTVAPSRSTARGRAPAASGSSCEVGSSRSSSAGSSASAEARQTRCSSPPESSAVFRPQRWSASTASRRALDARPDLRRRRRRGSRARTRPRSRRSSSRPGPPDPGRRVATVPGELGRPGAARVEAGDDDPAREAAAVEVRHEARRARGAASTCPSRTARAGRRPRPARARARRRAAPARRGRVREREPADGR